MDENVKAKLDAILKRDQEKQAQAQEAQNKAKSDVKARQEQWSKHVDRVFIPALQPITEMLNQKGWICKIEQPKENTLTVVLYRGGMRGASTSRPELQFRLDSLGKIWIQQSTPSVSRSDDDTHTFEDLTAQFVEQRTVALIEALVADSNF